ncbi:MAG: hypothetical protein DRQ65_09055 [Gammaproteobacteria bacterium]|nr:MAG: hypothetical protein DRQ65_09055 [Gammaproteobacteria bacterium]
MTKIATPDRMPGVGSSIRFLVRAVMPLSIALLAGCSSDGDFDIGTWSNYTMYVIEFEEKPGEDPLAFVSRLADVEITAQRGERTLVVFASVPPEDSERKGALLRGINSQFPDMRVTEERGVRVPRWGAVPASGTWIGLKFPERPGPLLLERVTTVVSEHQGHAPWISVIGNSGLMLILENDLDSDPVLAALRAAKLSPDGFELRGILPWRLLHSARQNLEPSYRGLGG